MAHGTPVETSPILLEVHALFRWRGLGNESTELVCCSPAAPELSDSYAAADEPAKTVEVGNASELCAATCSRLSRGHPEENARVVNGRLPKRARQDHVTSSGARGACNC
jgi:hypothetical protein